MKKGFFLGLVLVLLLVFGSCGTEESMGSQVQSDKKEKGEEQEKLGEQTVEILQDVMPSCVAGIPAGAVFIRDGKIEWSVDPDCTDIYPYNYAVRWKDIVSIRTFWDGTICAIDKDGKVHFDSENGRILTMAMENLNPENTYRKILYDLDKLVTLDRKGRVDAYSCVSMTGLYFPEEKMEELRNWTGVVDIATSCRTIMALFEDGTIDCVSFPGSEDYCVFMDEWEDIIAIVGGGETLGDLFAGLKSDGTVLIAGSSIGPYVAAKKWSNIASLAMDTSILMGVTKEGTIVATGNISKKTLDKLSSWENIVEVSLGVPYCIGVTREGEIVMEKIEHIR